MHQIPKLEWFSSRLAVAFAQSIQARCCFKHIYLTTIGKQFTTICPSCGQVLSREWRCSWSSADRRCSNYIWVIDNLIGYQGASYIRDLTVHFNYDILYGMYAATIRLFIQSTVWMRGTVTARRIMRLEICIDHITPRQALNGGWPPNKRDLSLGIMGKDYEKHLYR